MGLRLLAAEIPENYQSVRALGMGGVYTYDNPDAGMLFKNPAGLAKISGLNLSVFDLGIGLGGGASILSTMNSFSSMGSVSGISSLNSIYGKPIWTGGGAYSAIALPYFGFGIFDNASIGLRFDNPAYPNLNTVYFNDYGFSVGGAIPIGPVSIGLALKRTTRKGGDKNIGGVSLTNATNSTLASQFEDEGYGFGLDGGVLFAPPAPFNPMVSVAWQDMGSTAFTLTKGTQAPGRIKDNLTLGFSFGGEVPLLAWRSGIEYRHITDNNEVIGKKIHMGTEFTLAMFDFRAGLYQGYPSYGLGVDLFIMQLDAAYYKIEKGAYPGQTPDERVQISLSMNLDFDPNFHLTEGSGGKKRHLKQRR